MPPTDRSIAEGPPPALPRVRHRLAVPKSIPGKFREIVLQELTAADELAAEEAAASPRARVDEICKAMIVEVDGKPVSAADASSDAAWEAFHPKLRSLVNTAWARYHLANDKEADGFFASDTVEV